MLNKYFVMAMGVCVSASVSLADTFYVPGDSQTIQGAIKLCNQNGDDIIVSTGIYFEAIDFMGKSVWIHSVNGSGQTFIDAQLNNGPYVSFVTAEDENAILEGFTIRNCTSSAVIVTDASPTFVDCRFLNNLNLGSSGGAIHASNATIALTDCTFLSNEAQRGGGIYATNSTLSISGSTFRANSATSNDNATDVSGGCDLWDQLHSWA